MQLQFNNSPLERGEGGRSRPGKQRKDSLFSFFLFCHWRLLFSVFKTAHPAPSIPTQTPWEGRDDWKERGGLFSTFCFLTWQTHTHTQLVWRDAAEVVIDWMPLTEWTLSQAVLPTQAAGCVYWCVLPAKSRHQHQQQQQQRKGQTSSSNPPRYGKACWTEIMASRPACRLHAGPAKLPALSLMITTREH